MATWRMLFSCTSPGLAAFANFLHRGKQERDEDGNDGDDDKQFDQM